MLTPARLAFVLRRALRVACALATAVVVAAPLLLGPAWSTAVRLVGGEVVHKCACGMKPGKCGCPECERLEAQRQEEARPKAYPTLKGSCDTDDVAATDGALPTVAAAAAAGFLPDAELVAELADVSLPLSTQVLLEPSVPPPRRLPV